MEEKMTTEQAAKYLCVSSKTLWEWRNRCKMPLPYYRIGERRMMYLKSDLDAYMAKRRVDPDISPERLDKISDM